MWQDNNEMGHNYLHICTVTTQHKTGADDDNHDEVQENDTESKRVLILWNPFSCICNAAYIWVEKNMHEIIPVVGHVYMLY